MGNSRYFQPDFYHADDGANGLFNWVSDWNVAFSDDGLTGFAVIVGAERNAQFAVAPRPIVYKTIDGGDNCNKLPEFDFSSLVAFDTMLPYISGGNYVNPWFSDIAVNVDRDNRLHIFTRIRSGFSAHQDSLTYIYTHQPQNDVLTELLYDVHTSDGTDYKAIFVATNWNELGTISDGADSLAMGTRPQISRSPDGSKIFYSFLQTDILEFGYKNSLSNV